ncbi:MAG: glycosyltransferase [Rhodospirillaceae bacterium]|nr:glycosyltransferase [Rhodospirillaceae bacterium]
MLQPAPHPLPMKFLFFSPHAIADSCSGAARALQALFEALQELGHRCHILTGVVTDGKSELFDKALTTAPTTVFQIKDSDRTVPVRQFRLHGVEHILAGGAALSWQEMKAFDDTVLRHMFLDIFRKFDPDVVLTYGGFPCNYFAGQHAMAHGRKSVLFAASDTYRVPTDFIHVNTVAAISEALAVKLRPVTTAPIVALKALTKTKDVKSAARVPEFITFLNPSLPKGVKLAAAIVAECQKRGRPYKFLFVESRGTRAEVMHLCPELASCTNLFFAANITNIRAVYERTAILLYPSLWFETAGMAPIECNANGIPVLAHNIGGIPLMMDGAGFLFEPPPAMVEKWDAPPPKDDVAQWIAIIDRLHEDPAFLADAARRAAEADARYDLPKLARKFVDALA